MMPCQQALKPSLLARELLPVPQTHPWRGQEFRHEGCCCCQVTSVVSDSVRPQRRHPTRLPHPWDSPGKNTGVGCHFLLQCMKVKSESEVAQSCPTRSDPMDCSPPGSSVHGIFQARVLEWAAIAFSKPPATRDVLFGFFFFTLRLWGICPETFPQNFQIASGWSPCGP